MQLLPLPLLLIPIVANLADDSGGIATVGTSLVGSGFAIWYAWYMTTTQIPKLIDQHTQQIREITSSHDRTVGMLTTEFRADNREARESYRRESEVRQREVRQLTQVVDHLADKLGAPGPLDIRTDSVVIHRKGGKSDPSFDKPKEDDDNPRSIH